jgi:hypothetical protein
MKKHIALTAGLVVAGLAAANIFTKGKRLFGLDTEKPITVARVPIAASLLHAGTMGDDEKAGKALSAVGVSYLGMGGSALLDRKMGGVLKMRFSNTDIAFHLAVGALMLAASLLPDSDKARD